MSIICFFCFVSLNLFYLSIVLKNLVKFKLEFCGNLFTYRILILKIFQSFQRKDFYTSYFKSPLIHKILQQLLFSDSNLSVSDLVFCSMTCFTIFWNSSERLKLCFELQSMCKQRQDFLFWAIQILKFNFLHKIAFAWNLI